MTVLATEQVVIDAEDRMPGTSPVASLGDLRVLWEKIDVFNWLLHVTN